MEFSIFEHLTVDSNCIGWLLDLLEVQLGRLQLGEEQLYVWDNSAFWKSIFSRATAVTDGAFEHDKTLALQDSEGDLICSEIWALAEVGACVLSDCI